jgi:2'-5' RNA ligase
MPEAQGAFAFYRDLPRRPERPERLFFALIPDANTAGRIGRFADRLLCESRLEKGKRIEADRLHVSLHHVGDYRRLRTQVVYAARQAGRSVSMRPFEITFRSIDSFGGTPPIGGRPPRCSLVLRGEADALLQLHRSLGLAMAKNGLRAAVRFAPHMTLHYGPRRVPPRAIEPIRLAVNQFSLVHSELGLTKYNILDRWPLEE